MIRKRTKTEDAAKRGTLVIYTGTKGGEVINYITIVNANSQSFDFLKDEEDIYSKADI